MSAKSASLFAHSDSIVYRVTDSPRRIHAVDYVINLSLPLLRMSSTCATKFKFQLEKTCIMNAEKTPLFSSNLKMDTIQDIILRLVIVRIYHMLPEYWLRQILRHQICSHLISWQTVNINRFKFHLIFSSDMMIHIEMFLRLRLHRIP